MGQFSWGKFSRGQFSGWGEGQFSLSPVFSRVLAYFMQDYYAMLNGLFAICRYILHYVSLKKKIHQSFAQECFPPKKIFHNGFLYLHLLKKFFFSMKRTVKHPWQSPFWHSFLWVEWNFPKCPFTEHFWATTCTLIFLYFRYVCSFSGHQTIKG